MLYSEDATGMSILESAYGAQVRTHAPKTHAHALDFSRGLSKQELFFICNNTPLVSQRVDVVLEDED